MEALGRVELPTNGLGNRCSIHLSYRAVNGKLLKNHDLQLSSSFADGASPPQNPTASSRPEQTA